MKHLLKPTGQILTTAVMTSTAVDMSFPLVARPLPPASPVGETEPEVQAPVIDAAAIAHQAETIAPPEQEAIPPSFHHQGWSVLPEHAFANTTAHAPATRELAENPTISAPDQPMNHSPNPGTVHMAESVGDREPILATPSTRIFRPAAAPSQSAPPIPRNTANHPHNGTWRVEPDADPSGPAQPLEPPREAIAPGPTIELPSVAPSPVDAAPSPNALEELHGPAPEPLNREPLDRPLNREPSHPRGTGLETPNIHAPLANPNPQTDQDTNPTVVVETMDQTQNWLEQKLATIVAQTRDRQAFDTRQRLIDYARESIEIGDLAEARNVATHPILTPEEQEALAGAIAQAEASRRTPVQGFIPLVPLNEELDLIAIQSPDSNVQSSPPVGELPVLPTSPMSFPDRINRLPHSPALEYLSSKGTPPLSQLPLIPLATSGLHQWPGGQRGTGAGMGPSADGWPAPSSLTVDDWERCWATQVEVATMSPNPATFSDRHSFGNAPSNNLRLAHYSQLNHSEAIAPMDYIGTGQQPPSFTTTTQAFPSGADFLAGVGQQPPSILAESSEAEASIWSAEPMSFKWTRDRLNQELAILMANTTPADCQVILAAAATERNQDIGGPTVASLTGYEWLSQFTLPQQRAEPARPPIHMILPLPHAAPLTSKFGWRTHPIFGGQRFHYGLDYGAPHGTPILASIPGRVETTGSLDGYGLTVIVENEELGLRTLYAHMSGIGVNKGDGVEQGVVLGWVGNTGNSTGPHLHFEVHRYTDGGWVAIDPLQAAADLIEATKP